MSLEDSVLGIPGDWNHLGVRKNKKGRGNKEEYTFTISLVPCQRNIFPLG